MKLMRSMVLVFWLVLTAGAAGAADVSAPNPQFQVLAVYDAWQAGLPRAADAATQAYLDRLPPAVVERADNYFEGGYWLELWNFLLGLAVAWLMLAGQRAARVRDFAQRVGRKPFFRDALFGAIYALAAWLLTLPLAVYQGFVREHAYGMATQTFGAWFGEQLTGLAVGTLISALAVAALYALLRRVGSRWWLWGTAGAVALATLAALVSPVLIDPLFNAYRPVQDVQVKAAVLAMAHANGVPVDNVYEFDASRQTTRISANVSGIFGTAAVRLNDNLLRRTSLPEIRGVMAHELGHYVMNHIYKMLAFVTLLFAASFLFAQWAMARLLARHGARFGLRGVDDVASLPLLAAVLSVFMFAATPLFNTLIRTQEIEADRFALNLSREPHGLAEALLKLTEYRKPSPGPVEEFIFFDHPSTRHRIHDAMRWREAMGTP
jgi:STE24 endopeptidase